MTYEEASLGWSLLGSGLKLWGSSVGACIMGSHSRLYGISLGGASSMKMQVFPTHLSTRLQACVANPHPHPVSKLDTLETWMYYVTALFLCMQNTGWARPLLCELRVPHGAAGQQGH